MIVNMNFLIPARALCKPTAALLGLVLMSFAPIAAAQTFADDKDCILDNCADKKPNAQSEENEPIKGPQPRGASVAGDFDFYVLALSWSPGFCATGGAEKARSQCESGANLGFVVHGLWPQYEHGYPSDCGPAGRSPSRIALEATQGLYPDEGLARYEWRRHGTCSGKSPTDYFADVRRAREAIVIPQPFREARETQTWAPIDVQRAFIAANPRLRPGMLAVECVRGVMDEVRICFSKDLRNFVACPEVARQYCRTNDMSVPAMR